MVKIAIIGLGITGNSIGMALKRAGAEGQALHVMGFDPERKREELALRKYFSVDEIAPNLESVVKGAQLVIIATPATAVREVLTAMNPFLEEGTVVTDTLPVKEQIMAWAGETLGPQAGFVGGHLFAQSVDLETAGENETPEPDLFRGAPYCIMPLPGAGNEALSQVIWLAEVLGARPLFIDAREHDSFVAAISHLPVMASAALLRTIAGSPAWSDMSGLAHSRFRSVTEPLSANPETVEGALAGNRQALLRWVDQYLLALQDLRDMLASGNGDALLEALTEAHEARVAWAAEDEGNSPLEAQLRADTRQAIDQSRLSRNLMGTYLTGKIFHRGEGDRGRDQRHGQGPGTGGTRGY